VTRDIRPLNVKAHALTAVRSIDVRGYTVEGCCPSFAPGWEVSSGGQVDPCPWTFDLPYCHGLFSGCWWAGQVPDERDNPNWLDNCSNYQNDWTNLCVVPD